VRADADVVSAAESLVDGACFNSGQSCCGVERIYVHRDVFDAFVARAAEVMSSYVVGDPLDPETTLGPMVRTRAADYVRTQMADAEAAGARGLVDPSSFGSLSPAFVPPQLYVDVDHGMALMSEETFGPIVGVMAVEDDDHAVALMNDSQYGLTASIWTTDEAAAMAIGVRLETGTVFMNRCDYLDPHLAWTGVKDSGRGATLSRIGYEQLTRPKSFHFRTA
jgi:acyl-CoA reductase-like NAD-dependent aldehyde dehydrogenase